MARSTDRGATFELESLPLDSGQTVEHVWSSGETHEPLRGEVVAVDRSDTFFRSLDRGASWQDAAAAWPSGGVAGIACMSGVLYATATSDDHLYESRDLGATFLSRPSPMQEALLFAVDGDGLYAVHPNGFSSILHLY